MLSRYLLVSLIYSSAIVAKNLVQDSFGMVFGLNGFVASILLLLYNVVIVSETFFSFNPRELYTIFGSYFYVLVLLFSAYGIARAVKK